MKKVVKALMFMWLMIGVVCFCLATYHLIYTGYVDALYFYFFAGLAGLLFYVRKRQLRRFEKMSK